MTWWKLAIIAFVCGVVSLASGLLTGANALLLWISTSGCMGLGILFLAVELLTSESRPSLGLGGAGPKTNRWRTRIAIIPLVVAMIGATAQVASKVNPLGAGSPSQSVYFYSQGEGKSERCEAPRRYGAPN